MTAHALAQRKPFLVALSKIPTNDECVVLGIMRRPGRPAVDIDPTGKVFATALSRNYVKLYDISNFSAGPFVDQQVRKLSTRTF